MADNKLEIILSAKDISGKTFEVFKGKVNAVDTSLTKFSGSTLKTLNSQMASTIKGVFSLKGAFAALGTVSLGIGLSKIATSAVDVANSFEQMELKLNQLTKGNGKQTLEELNAWALKMPVNTRKAVDSFVMMQAMGLDPTIKKMQILVDTSSLMGEEALPRISRALGQMQTLGKLSAEELNQMSEVGINARGYLKDAFGQTVEEIQKSGIKIEKVVDAIWKGLDKDFGGAAVKAMNTWQGLTATTVSYFEEIERKLMAAGVFELLKDQLKLINNELIDWIKNNETFIRQDLPKYVNEFRTSIKETVDFFKTAYSWYKKIKDLSDKIPSAAKIGTAIPGSASIVQAVEISGKAFAKINGEYQKLQGKFFITPEQSKILEEIGSTGAKAFSRVTDSAKITVSAVTELIAAEKELLGLQQKRQQNILDKWTSKPEEKTRQYVAKQKFTSDFSNIMLKPKTGIKSAQAKAELDKINNEIDQSIRRWSDSIDLMAYSFSDIFYDALTGNLKSFADYGKVVASDFAGYLSDEVSKELASAVKEGLLTSDKGGGGSVAGSIGGTVASNMGPAGGYVALAAVIVGGFASAANANQDKKNDRFMQAQAYWDHQRGLIDALKSLEDEIVKNTNQLKDQLYGKTHAWSVKANALDENYIKALEEHGSKLDQFWFNIGGNWSMANDGGGLGSPKAYTQGYMDQLQDTYRAEVENWIVEWNIIGKEMLDEYSNYPKLFSGDSAYSKDLMTVESELGNLKNALGELNEFLTTQYAIGPKTDIGAGFISPVSSATVEEAFPDLNLLNPKEVANAYRQINDKYLSLIAEIESKYLARREEVFNSLDRVLEDLTGTGSKFQRELTSLEKDFNSWVDTLKDSGASLSELTTAQEKYNQAIEATIQKPFLDLKESYQNYKTQSMRSAWGISEYTGFFHEVAEQIESLDQTSGSYYDDALALFQQQFEALQNINGLQAQQLSVDKQLVKSLDNSIWSLTGGSLAPVQSAGGYEMKYAELMQAAQSGNVDAVQEFAAYATGEYLDFMKAFGGNYSDLTGAITADLENTRAYVQSEIDYLSRIADNTEHLSGIDRDTGYLRGIDADTANLNSIDRDTSYLRTIDDNTDNLEDSFLNGIDALSENVVNSVNAMGKTFFTNWNRDAGTFNESTIVPGIRYAYAFGGLTRGPSLAGEAGPEWVIPTYEPERTNFLRSVGVDSEKIGKSIAKYIGSGGGENHIHISIDGREIAYVVNRQARTNPEDLRHISNGYI